MQGSYISCSCNWLQDSSGYSIILFISMTSVFLPSSARISADLGYLPDGRSLKLTPKGPTLSTGFMMLSFSLTFSIGYGSTKRHSRESTGLKTKSSLASLCYSNPVSPWYSRSVTPTNTGTLPPTCSSSARSPKWSGRSLIFQFRGNTIVPLVEAFPCEVLSTKWSTKTSKPTEPQVSW